nr:hypothetical protein [uncultured Cohaesibacter sp.]
MYLWGIVFTFLLGLLFWAYRDKATRYRFYAHPDAVIRARQAYERASFESGDLPDPLTGVDDPSLAAAILMVGFVRLGGGMTEADSEEMTRLLTSVAQLDSADDHLAYACFVNDAERDVCILIDGMAEMLRDTLTYRERHELMEMVKRICSHRSMTTSAQTDALQTLRHGLGLLD